MTRSVEELRRDSEQSRAQLAATVDRLREQIADTAEDIRYKVSPEHIKAEVSGFISHKTHGWMDALKQQAMDNPMQAIAAGTAIAVPALRLARGFPLPLLMIGVGLALSSKTVRDRAAEAAAPGLRRRGRSSTKLPIARSPSATACGKRCPTLSVRPPAWPTKRRKPQKEWQMRRAEWLAT